MLTSRSAAATATVRWLGVWIWALVVLGVVAASTLEPPSHDPLSESLLVLLLNTFFGSVLLRLVVAIFAFPTRRRPLIALLGGVCLWAGGASVLASGGPIDELTFPAPGEGLFLASYAGLAAFLLLDVQRAKTRVTTIWLESIVICGGTACIAGFVLLVPAAMTTGAGDVPVLLAYLYPTIDLVLGMLVLAQALLHQRDRTWRTVLLGLGFLALALADSSFVFSLSSETYVSNWALNVVYAVSFTLVVGAACQPTSPGAAVRVRSHGAGILVAAATVAVAVLVLRPGGVVGWYVILPAIVTLLAAGGRLILALREATGAVEARKLSRTDELTGLPNRRAVLQDVEDGIAQGGPLALMLLDLDGFKDINDSLGHAAGDEVLCVVANRLTLAAAADTFVARLGGDEFALLVRDDDPVRLVEEAQRIRQILLEPMMLDNLELAIRASVGITVHGSTPSTGTDLLRQADVAMYEAKVSRAGALLYDASRDGFSKARLHMVEDLRRGIADGQLVVWYQPQVDAVTQRPTAVEALVRWQHPQHGLLQPVAFLPEARRSGLMLALTEAVMKMVVADARRWIDEGFDFRVSFNCAPPELLGGALLPRLFDAISRARLPPETLLIEVTEDSFLSDPEGAREALLQLRSRHVQAAIDDYGTGFSSLAYLRDLPVQELKIDRSFVSTILTDPRSRVIVDSTNRMAVAMGLRLVAEGVEHADIAVALRAMGVEVLQGYHIARPMPAEDIGPWMRRRSALRDYVSGQFQGHGAG